MLNLLQDLRFAFRQWRRFPGFVVTAVITLALGIGANVAAFGVLQALILRPLSAPNASRVMNLQPAHEGEINLSFPEMRDVQEQSTVFSAVAADRLMDFGLEARGTTRPVWGDEVSGQYFEVLGIKPRLGRLLQPSDNDHPDAAEVAVLSSAAWQSDFDSDPEIVGKTVRIDKHPYTIVGVTPAGFYGTEKFLQPDLFVPMANEGQFERDWLESRNTDNIWAIVRIKDGITLPQVQAELNTITAHMARQHPMEEEHLSLKVSQAGLLGDLFGSLARKFLIGVMALAGIVLLATCVNLGSLFAARTADRGRELAIRVAIGSSRWRIVRQILIEAFLIAAVGGGLGCALAWKLLTALNAWRPVTNIPFRLAVFPEPSLILVALILSVCAGMLCGVMPLRQILSTDPNDALRPGSGFAFAGRRWTFRDLLLALQIALCCVTVTAAFVSLRGLQKALTMQLGFEPDQVVRTKFDLALSGYKNDTAEHFQRELLERAAQLPGVDAVSYANTTPLAVDQSSWGVYPQQAVEYRPSTVAFAATVYDVAPGYFQAAGTRMLAGRDVTLSDGPHAPVVAVVNREFAQKLFHADQAVGRYFKNGAGQLIQIIGMVEDGKYEALSEDPRAAIFFPILQKQNTATTLVVRTRADANAVARTIAKLVHDLDPAVPVQESGAWRKQLALQLLPAVAATAALSLFGIFGLVLSVTGTFGLASYTVAKRLRELSIRVALGAQAKEILAVALGRMITLVTAGVLVGLIAGMATGRILSAIVYHASAQDPLVMIAVAGTMLLTGVLSILGPVRRALHVDPAHLLREE